MTYGLPPMGGSKGVMLDVLILSLYSDVVTTYHSYKPNSCTGEHTTSLRTSCLPVRHLYVQLAYCHHGGYSEVLTTLTCLSVVPRENKFDRKRVFCVRGCGEQVQL
eukprot:TRINITY_DN1402_c0_g3_i1.p2 TRINITY_DN1402_c0_g3~~TRINITY_DN1402_c0_g3_i1.p2  ORF type:complete len:106 (+),score=1.42 TRINITY_DN1402_c0_g3_i1:720-1037(+)